jgi:uncharacterized protein (DUF779 family)
MDEPNEPYRLRFEERPQYLYVRVSADTIDRASALSYLDKVAKKCADIGARKMMIVRDIRPILSDTDVFFTTQDFLNMTKGVRVAFVNPYFENSEHMKFAVRVATNRGGRFSVHNTEAEAERALLAGSRPG